MKTFLSIMLFVFMLSMLKAQTIIHVPADQPTIQAGVNAASNGDTILVSDGTYSGSGNSEISLGGKEIVVKSQNGPENCILDGEGTRYFGFADGISYEGLSASIEGFTIRNFKGPGFYYYWGACPNIIGNIIELCTGGIELLGEGDPIVENNIIQNNGASGIEAYNFTGKISSNIIRGNRDESGAGGGILLRNSEAIIMNNIISGNYAPNAGGGIYAIDDTSHFINNTIINNSSRKGSGIYVGKSNPTLVNNIIAYSVLYLAPEDDKFSIWRDGDNDILITYTYNQGVLSGATIFTGFINMGAACEVTIAVAGIETNQTVYAEPYERFSLVISCGIGGTRYVYTKISTLTDTLEINAYSPEVNLTPANYSLTSYGIDANPCGLLASESEDITPKNCAFFGNKGGGYFTGNDEEGYTEVVLSGVNGNVTSDPLLNENDYSLSAGSPCIDNGIPDTSGLNLPAFDITGAPRITDGNDDGVAVIDIGAYEYDNTTDVKWNNKVISSFKLLQNYPNPFNPSTKINFSLPQTSFVSLKVYDVLGKEVVTLVFEEKTTGNYKVDFDGSNLSSGIYFYRMQAGNYSDTKKFILMK